MGGRRRILLDWVVQAAVLLLVGHVVPGILVENLGAALFAAVVLGLLNALVRPVIILLTLPLNVLTVGLLSLVVNAMMLSLAAPLVPGFEVTSFAGAFAAAVVITVLTTLISIVLASNRDDTFYAELVAPDGGHGDAARRGGTRPADRPGRRPLRADPAKCHPGGADAAHGVLGPQRPLPAGRVGLRAAVADVGQPGGDPSRRQHDIPAFRWYEKERGPADGRRTGRPTPPRSSAGSRTAGGSWRRAARASATSSRATRSGPCSR